MCDTLGKYTHYPKGIEGVTLYFLLSLAHLLNVVENTIEDKAKEQYLDIII